MAGGTRVVGAARELNKKLYNHLALREIKARERGVTFRADPSI